MVNKTKPNCPIGELLEIRIRTTGNSKQTKLKKREDGLAFRAGEQKRIGEKGRGSLHKARGSQ